MAVQLRNLKAALRWWNRTVTESTFHLIRSGVVDGWRVGVDQADLTPDKAPSPAAIAFARRHYAAGIRRLGDDARLNITGSVVRGLREGLNPQDIEDAIASEFAGDAWRIPVIARTELNRAENYGRLAAWKDSNVVKAKEWITAGDDRVRPSHSVVDGEIVAKGKRFSLGVLAPPGGPNCRCTVAPRTSATSAFQAAESVRAFPLAERTGELVRALFDRWAEFERRVKEGVREDLRGQETARPREVVT